MGYYTMHSLEVSDSNKETHEAGIASITDYDSNYLWHDECKWYSHEEDMKRYSKSHPEVLFTLTGHGEESGDSWVEFYKNGQFYREKFVAPKFDESKLK